MRVSQAEESLDPKLFKEDGDVAWIKKNKFVEIGDEKKAHFIKCVFSKEEMSALGSALLESNLWEYREDKNRGSKPFFINGRWTQRGHARYGVDGSYPAGRAGKSDNEANRRVIDLLQPLAVIASQLLQKYRGDIAEVVGDMDNPYGLFHLFMTPRGVSKMHRDRNDFISFMFLIQSPGEGGELEIGGTKHAVAWEVGDAVIMDTSTVYHGSRAFEGDENGRLVGLFIVHKPFCSIHGKTVK